IVQLDEDAKERLRMSRLAREVIDGAGSGSPSYLLPKISADDPEFVEAIGNKVYYGPVYGRRIGWYMNMSFAGTRRDAGVSVFGVSVKFIWEVVRQIKADGQAAAYVLDAQGRVIAHSNDYSLFQRDFSSLPRVQAASVTGVVARDIGGRKVLI